MINPSTPIDIEHICVTNTACLPVNLTAQDSLLALPFNRRP